MDFTIQTYKKLLTALSEFDVKFLPYKDFHVQTQNINAEHRYITLRHDVDAKKQNSLAFAQIQNAMGIAGTYYFRTVPQSYDETVIMQIAELGHEIGYHYETMDTSKGNVDKAYNEFCKNLEMFRKFIPVTTVCMHGSPLSKFDNRDIWQKYDYKKLGIIAEPYFDVDFNKTFYITDTGRRWDGGKVSVRDKTMGMNNCTNPDFLKRTYKSTQDIINDIQNKNFPDQTMFTFHPQRWNDNILEWGKELVLQNAKNIVKRYFYVK